MIFFFKIKEKLFIFYVIFYFINILYGFGTNCRNEEEKNNNKFMKGTLIWKENIPENLKVVFIADQGLNSISKEVLKNIKNFGADFVIHSGDLDYLDDPSSWIEQIDSILGYNFPYFVSIGNHEINLWNGVGGYQDLLIQRSKRFNISSYCYGDYGVNMACNYKGLQFILSGVGTMGNNHAKFIDDIFNKNPNIWRICSWHKVQHLLQTGSKKDETGYEVYETCRKHGAIIATAHEHSYARTYLMKDFVNQIIENKNNTLVLSPGKSFCFVCGLGGISISKWHDELEKNPWWAATASSNVGVAEGALYCIFNVNGDNRKATCKFQDRNGKIWDQFDIISQLFQNEIKPSFENINIPRWIEYQISSAENDYSQKSNSEKFLYLNDGITTLTFTNISLTKNDKIINSYLQFLGAEDGKYNTSIIIQGLLNHSKLTNSFVIWEIEDGNRNNWIKNTIWITPNLKQIIQEIIQDPLWKKENSSITFLITSKENYRIVYSYEYSKCHAPSLTIQLENQKFLL